MKREFTPRTRDSVLGNVNKDSAQLKRIPLHVEFGTAGSGFAKAELLSFEEAGNATLFNGIGSRNDTLSGRVGRYHLPVIDVDGGASTQRTGCKAILGVAYEGEYGPASLLRDVLGDNGIDLEV